jgi:hypothetical protein
VLRALCSAAGSPLAPALAPADEQAAGAAAASSSAWEATLTAALRVLATVAPLATAAALLATGVKAAKFLHGALAPHFYGGGGRGRGSSRSHSSGLLGWAAMRQLATGADAQRYFASGWLEPGLCLQAAKSECAREVMWAHIRAAADPACVAPATGTHGFVALLPAAAREATVAAVLEHHASASVAAASGSPVTGRVRTVAPTVDPQTRSGLVYVDLPSGPSRQAGLKAGMFASGEFELGSSPALTVPQQAVVVRDGFSYVFRLNADQRVSQLKVQTGRRVGERVELLDGVGAESSLVASGAGFLNDGDLVKVAPAAALK